MLKEFKKFIARGNVMDLAVGVIVGGAFSSIVTSLVENILMPIIGVITGGIDFSKQFVLKVGDATINFGMFLQSVIDFLIVAFCIFLMVKVVNKILHTEEKKEEKKEEKPKKSDEVLVLEEIRNILKNEPVSETKKTSKESKEKKKK